MMQPALTPRAVELLPPQTRRAARDAGRRAVRGMDMDAKIEAVLAVNDSFYRALSMADFSAMQRVWLTSDEAVCVHPGWPPLHGWEAIRESWQRIFENQGPLHIWATDAATRLYGFTAEVACIENIDTAQVAGTGITQSRATNIFRRVEGAWKMLEHHAAPMPPESRRRHLRRYSSN
jgi:ketosteroid isomerase-like protein